MTEEEGSSNYDLELNPSQSDYLIKLQNDLNNLQVRYIEEKEKSLNLEKKIFYLENKEKIQKIKSDNEQKDEKINLLEKANNSFNKKISDLTIEMEQLRNIIYEDLNFIKIENKWKEIDISNFKCCENKCINTNKPIGNCIEGNGFVNLINDGNINYIKCVEGKGVNKDSLIYIENSFKKPQNCINYSLYYFELKCMKMEGKLNDSRINIGLKIGADHKYVRIGARTALISNEKNETFKLTQFTWNNNDVFGCGLIYPLQGFPYIFFTQNGKQIGKAVLLKDSSDSYKPYIVLKCCSVETNFGEDLENKPFIYDFSKHLVHKFY
uniref:Uncharacterized protein n=2 Tax=Meloidogyne TaxID=189290 RepID=A0A6V7W5B8_MELEN|nr:unnamed protein product [Meloidogyne enterolobii]